MYEPLLLSFIALWVSCSSWICYVTEQSLSDTRDRRPEDYSGVDFVECSDRSLLNCCFSRATRVQVFHTTKCQRLKSDWWRNIALSQLTLWYGWFRLHCDMNSIIVCLRCVHGHEIQPAMIVKVKDLLWFCQVFCSWLTNKKMTCKEAGRLVEPFQNGCEKQPTLNVSDVIIASWHFIMFLSGWWHCMVIVLSTRLPVASFELLLLTKESNGTSP